MVIYVLIVIFSYRGGVAMQEFNTQDACYQARTAIIKGDHWGAGAFKPDDVLCMPKGKP